MKKLFFDLFPIILFFAAYQIAQGHPVAATDILNALNITLSASQKPGVFVATLVAIAATFAQIGWVKLRGHKVDVMLWVSLVLITVFGSATLFFHNETFIQWKPTVLYGLFATALFLSPWVAKRNLIQLMMQNQLSLPDVVWGRLNLLWAGFFAFMGATNLLVAFNFDMDTWVSFKLFGTLGMMLVFILGQGLYLARHLKEPS